MECKNGKNFNRTRIQAEGNFVCPKKHWTLLYYLNSLFYLYFSPDQNLTSERDRATTPTENVLEMNFFFSLIKTWLNKSRARINFFFLLFFVVLRCSRISLPNTKLTKLSTIRQLNLRPDEHHRETLATTHNTTDESDNDWEWFLALYVVPPELQ